MSGDESTSGCLAAYLNQETRKQAMWWALAAVSVPIAGAAVWWLSETTLDTLAPPEYRYRPGTVSEYISGLLAKHAKQRRRRKPMRVYMDGCFDVMHYGHANALRQARALGDQLVVGMNSDEGIRSAKGPPVMDYEERKKMVGAVKWVDEIIDDAPYVLNPEFLQELFTKHKIDYVVHGDDPCLLPDGTDAYAYAKQLRRFIMIKRTEGVSSTDIVGRMLMCTRDNARFREERRELTKQFSSGQRRAVLGEAANGGEAAAPSAGSGACLGDGEVRAPPHTTLSRFMPTSRRIVQFSNGVPAPPGARTVYIDGAFDLFHPGHVDILKMARAQGDFLLVGLHGDEAVMERRGAHLPIMDLHERALSVLACRYVNEVILGAPMEVTDDLLTTFNISLVVRGTVSETAADGADADARRYAIPREKGVFRTLESPSSMTGATIIHRIVRNRAQYEARNARKSKSEAAYYKDKAHVTEM